MTFKDLDDFLESSLTLPMRGKKYIFESLDAETGLWVQRTLETAARIKKGEDPTEEELAKLNLTDDQERSLYERLMGDTWAEMIADNLPWEYIKLAGGTVMMWALKDRETAEKFWHSGGKPTPKAVAAPADRKPPAKKTTARRASPAGSTKKSPGPASAGRSS